MAACNNCNTGLDSKSIPGAGCGKNGYCLTESCHKLSTYDWLADIEASEKNIFDVVEVRFKNGRKDFFRNKQKFDIQNGDAVIIDVPNGHHLGYISLKGELVRLQMLKKKVADDDNIRCIYRIATRKDISKFEEVCKNEESTLYRTRKIIESQKLKMKLTDVEYQADGTKATFFYSAEERVDFRELIKTMASEFRIRIEMRQINLRQEASRIGGISSCGRELCCSTWLTDFKSVSTSAARYQNLSLNPNKLSGQCGRLKCCLNFELDTYMEALKDIPSVKVPLITERGEARLQKTDIFKCIMWFGYENDNSWIPISAKRVMEILKMNKEGQKPATLKENAVVLINEASEVLNSDLEKLDRKYKNRNKKGRSKKNHNKRWKNKKNR